MERSNLHELLSALEEIRASEYPEISPEIIAQIVQAQYENQDNRAAARVQTTKLIAEYLLKETEGGK